MQLLAEKETTSVPIVYPIGYSSPYAMQRIDELMQQPKMLLIDTRHKPKSRQPQWSKNTLERVYENSYCWEGESLGNKNIGTDLPIELANPEPGIARLCEYLQRGYRLILLCQCAVYASCHRASIVRWLLRDWSSIHVVQPESLPTIVGYHGISIRPPYAKWIADQALFIEHNLPPKDLENRDWYTNYRGEILIHSSTTFEQGALEYWERRIPGLKKVVPLEKSGYPQGAFIARAQFTDVVSASNSPWFRGKYGFILQDARPIEPVPYPGTLGIFEIPRSVISLETSPRT